LQDIPQKGSVLFYFKRDDHSLISEVLMVSTNDSLRKSVAQIIAALNARPTVKDTESIEEQVEAVLRKLIQPGEN
jgi:hypothetical protein